MLKPTTFRPWQPPEQTTLLPPQPREELSDARDALCSSTSAWQMPLPQL